MLHRHRAAALAQFGERGLTCVPAHFGSAHLDQFVRGQRTLDFGAYRIGQSLAAEDHQRFQGMCARLERAALRRGQCRHAGSLLGAMPRSKSSAQWLRRHVDDPFVKKAKAQGLRSRAAFKLQEIDARDRLLRPGASVVDLGAAPGSWSQYAARRVGAAGCVVAVDLLEVEPIPGVTILRGDFLDAAVVSRVREAMRDGRADVVLCDLSPNLSGIASADQARAAALAEQAIAFCRDVLAPGGVFLVKVFQGAEFRGLLDELKRTFVSVQTRKPAASREESRETYLLCRGLRGG